MCLDNHVGFVGLIGDSSVLYQYHLVMNTVRCWRGGVSKIVIGQ